MKSDYGYPKFVYETWCSGYGNIRYADEFPRYSIKWLFYKTIGMVKFYLFGWWWYPEVK